MKITNEVNTMTTMKRIEMRRYVRPRLIDAFTKIYLSKDGSKKNYKLNFVSYSNSGVSVKFDHSDFCVLVNMYNNGEVSYVFDYYREDGERQIIIPAADTYESEDVEKAISDFIKLVKTELKAVNKGERSY